MYCQFYHFKEKPFNVTADPAFFFSSHQHQEALAHLFYGVNQRKGIIVITGEIGTGKTTLCRFFLNQLDKTVKTAFILNPYLPQIQLLEAIVKDFGISIKARSKFALIWELNRFLLQESEKNNNVVLVIDEAQNLKIQQLEQIRLLSNLETEKNKLLQIILVGQPELNHKLNLYELRQLKQRIMVRYHISPLLKEEIANYIRHRLEIAGSSGNPKFTSEAILAISEFSKGIPRLINIICDRALLAGFVIQTNIIDIDIIKRCIEELSNDFVKQI